MKKLFLTLLILMLWSLNGYAKHFVVTSDIWKPFFVADENGTEYSGIAIDVLDEIFSRTGDTYSIEVAPMRRAEWLIDNGHVDLIIIDSPIWNDPDKVHYYLFSETITYVEEHVVVLKERQLSIEKEEDLDGLHVGIRSGYRYPAVEESIEANSFVVKEVNNDPLLVRLLQSSRLDAIFIDDMAFKMAIKEHGISRFQFTKAMQLSHADLSIKLSPNNADSLSRINQAIREMKRDGSIKRIIQFYTE